MNVLPANIRSPIMKSLPKISNEPQTSEAKRTEVCWANYPRGEAEWD